MTIYEAIPKIMQSVGAIAKGKRNQKQGYAFRGIDDLYNAIQPALIENGVFIIPKVLESKRYEYQTQSGNANYCVSMRVEYTWYSIDGTSFTSIVEQEAMDSFDKASGKCLSMSMKYTLMQVLCIPTEDIEDSDKHTPEETRPNAKPADKPKDHSFYVETVTRLFLLHDHGMDEKGVADTKAITDSKRQDAAIAWLKTRPLRKAQELTLPWDEPA